MSLIGLMCKRGDTFSLQVLIGRGLFLLFQMSFRLSITLYSFQETENFKHAGVYGDEVTPVPIPNTEVKLIREDDTWLVTAREIISMPAFVALLWESFFHIFVQ